MVDISNPANPVQVGSIATTGNSGWTINVNGMYASGHYVYMTEWTGYFLIYDVSNPANPVNVATLNPGGNPTRVMSKATMPI